MKTNWDAPGLPGAVISKLTMLEKPDLTMDKGEKPGKTKSLVQRSIGTKNIDLSNIDISRGYSTQDDRMMESVLFNVARRAL